MPSTMAEAAAGELLARYYDLDLGDDQPDVDLYLALAEAAQGPVLELAAGSGRVAVPLARAGHAVTAVDHDAQMLARARGRWQAGAAGDRRGTLEFIEGDITNLSLERRFGLVILALNTLLMMPDRDAQLAALRTIAGHLLPTGRAAIDVWLPAPADLAIYDGRLNLDWLRRDPQTGALVAKLTCGDFDPATASARVLTFFDSWPEPTGALTRISREDHFRLLSADELLAMLGSVGLHAEVSGGDYALTPFGTGSERLVVVCALL